MESTVTTLPLLEIRPSSRRSEDSGVGMNYNSSRESTPPQLRDLSMTSSMSSTASSNISLTSSNFNDKPPIHSKSTQNSTPNNSNKSVRRARSYRRTCSLRNIGAGQMVSARSSSNERLVKKPFFNASVDEIALKPTSQKSRAITMNVKRSAYGRRGWIVSPTEPGIELNQLKLNGTLDQLIHEIKVLELSGKEVPCRMTVRVQN